MKQIIAGVIVLGVRLCATAQTTTNTLAEGVFHSADSYPPDASKFVAKGDVGYSAWSSSTGGLCLNTNTNKLSEFYSVTGRVAVADRTLHARLFAVAYHDGGIYGNYQPRGLRAGTDGNNAVEFYSASASTIGMRVVKNGSTVWSGTPCNAGEYWMYSNNNFAWRDYQIDVTSTSAIFRVDGTVRGTYTGSGIPTGALNLYAGTYYGGGGNNNGMGQIPVFVREAGLYLIEATTGTIIQDGLIYTVDVKTQCATVIGLTNLVAGSDVVIPPVINVQGTDYRVTSIQSDAFVNNTCVQTVTLSTNITSVSYSLFTGCTGLTGFDVQANHPTYSATNGALCSKDGSQLLLYPYGRSDAFTIPNGVTTVGANAFRESRISEVTLPTNVATVGNYAFYGCSQLTAVHFSIGLQTIGEWSFSSTKVAELILPEGLISVGYGAFRFNYSMKYIEMPSSLQTYPNEMASSCGLESILMKPGVKKTGYSVFWGNYNLKEIVLPEGLEELGIYAFDWCQSVTNIVLSSTFKKAYGNTFANDPKLKHVAIPEGTPRLSGGSMFYLATTLGEIQIASTVTQLEHSPFCCCYSLSNVTFAAQSQLTDMGESSFRWCRSLPSFTFPTNLYRLGPWAFEGCTVLQSPYLPASLQRVDTNVFGNCVNFDGIYFDGNKPSVWGGNVFEGVSQSVNVYVWDQASGFGDTLEGHPVVRLLGTTIDSATSITGCAPNQAATSLNLPLTRNGTPVVRIADWAFAGDPYLEQVTIPINISVIDCTAFAGCTNLTSLDADEENAFYRTKGGVLYSADGTTLILCPPGRKTMTVPATVTGIAEGALTGCVRLKAIYFQGEPPAEAPSDLFADVPDDCAVYCLDKNYAGGTFAGKTVNGIGMKVGSSVVDVQTYSSLLSDKVTQADLDTVATNLESAGCVSSTDVSNYLAQADIMGIDLNLLAQSNNVERLTTDIEIDGFAVTQEADMSLDLSQFESSSTQATSVRLLQALSTATLSAAAQTTESADSEDSGTAGTTSYKPMFVAISIKVQNGITSDEEALARFQQSLNKQVKAVVMTQLGGTETEIAPSSISYEGDCAIVTFTLSDDGSDLRFMKIRVISDTE